MQVCASHSRYPNVDRLIWDRFFYSSRHSNHSFIPMSRLVIFSGVSALSSASAGGDLSEMSPGFVVF